MHQIDRVLLRIGRGLSWGFLAIAAVMVYEVAARYGFNAPTSWAHEIAGVLAAVAFVFGGVYCMAERSHMRIGLLFDGAKPRWRRLAEALSLLCGAVYLGGLALAMWPISQKSLFRFSPEGAWLPERSGTSWNTAAPAIVKFALFLGAALFLAVIVLQAWRLLRGRLALDPPDREP
ncbi:MAG: TRAP transporter small permease [Kiloniellales bacterium]|nr:TRAP transporter small permease [Kiloniellales bacterium]